MSRFVLRRLAVPLLLSLSALALPQLAQASHFRGGSITWQALDLDDDGAKDDVRITVKTAWRRDSIDAASLASTPALTMTSVSQERLCVGLGTTTATTCATGTDYALQTTLFEAKNLDPNVPYTVAFTGTARIKELENNKEGDWNIQTTILLKDGNLAPKVDLPIILEVPMLKSGGGTLPSWTFDISSSDPNADKLRYRLANPSELGCDGTGCGYTNPVGLSINPNTGLLTWTNSGSLAAGDMYSAGIVAEDVDAFGAAKSKTHVDFILMLVNKAALEFNPQDDIVPDGGEPFPETRNVRVDKGTSYTFEVTASNVDTTSLGSLQGTLVESSTSPNTFTFAPGAPDDPDGLEPGAYPITFQLEDSSGTRSDSYLVINFIVPDPDAPRILNIEGDRTVYNNDSTTPGDAAEQLVDEAVDAVVEDVNSPQLDGGFALFNVTFTDGSYERLDIESVGDGAGEIRVDGDQVYYAGQVIGAIDPTQDGVGRALRIDFTSSDATLPAVQALVRSLTYQDTFTLRPAGDRALSLYIQDAEGHSNSYDFFVDVEQHVVAPPLNTGPVEAANRISVTEGTTTALSDSNIRYADPDGDAITFTVASVTHGKFEFVSTPGVAITTFTQQDVTLGKVAFAHNGDEAAPTYSISATDGTHPTAASPGEVTYFGTDDNTPVISGTPATTVEEGAAYSFTPTANDADVGIGGELTFSIANKPSWASFDTTTGELSGTPAHGDIGPHAGIVISVSDDGGLTKVNLAGFSIAVTEPSDSDSDGLPDYRDPNDSNIDSDGDGIPDGADVDVDGDGSNDNGTDSDGDGINDAADADGGGTDTDGDGIDDSVDMIDDSEDADGDGLPDDIDSNDNNTDTDGDGIPDGADVDVDGDGTNDNGTDADNDGIKDSADVDVDGDGTNDNGADTDGDGIADAADPIDGNDDADHDGLPDAVDPNPGNHDTDGDGIPDGADVDVDGDGTNDNGTDADDDGIKDSADVDADGDGTDDNGADVDGDGINDDYDTIDNPQDSDGDGLPDAIDPNTDNPDTDGDGIPDGADVDVDGDGTNDNGTDSDGDGINDVSDADGGTDTDGDGIDESVDTSDDSQDADGDGLPDAFDPDDGNADMDGDGIPDGADVDVDGDGTNDNGADSDHDGINDAADANGGPDSDGDGIGDAKDTIDDSQDADGDGLPDAIDPDDTNPDTDGDGIPDGVDADVDGDGTIDNGADADHDGINDRGEGTGDSDGDGTPDYLDSDSDNDGIGDGDEGASDPDGDGIPSYLDTDNDGDGVPDSAEGGGDTDGDGVPDYIDLDVDGDGIPDTDEGTGDADGDGVPDYRDTDSDNDGVSDAVEGAGDTDGDGTPDYLDDSIDEDRDGIPDVVEGAADSDGDGVPNFLDTDSDNDGVPDALELTGLRLDRDGDGIPDRFDVDQTGGLDGNGDGIDDGPLPDADHDGRPDLFDPDQDNDGIPDVIESGAYGFDSDHDGIDDRWDADLPGSTDANGDGIADDARAVDTDMDGIPDLLDLDSDRDGVSDKAESGAKGVDTDADGIDDAFDVDNVGGADANGDGLADSVKARDSDGDGIADFRDLDSDNDSISDVMESGGLDEDEDSLLDIGGKITSTPRDSDGDGTPDLRDLDSDNDGTHDIERTIYKKFDRNGDGRVDAAIDADEDGIPDSIDVEPGQRGSRSDNDSDGVPVNRDEDDDGDGIPDSVEGDGDSDGDGTVDRLDRDADNDGIPDRIEMGLPAPSGTDANGNGVDDAYENAASRDTDGDGVPDMLDEDSDNDGIPDAKEILLVPLSGADSDGDGIDDAIDVDATGGVDANGDGVDDSKVNLADTDGDGLPDYRDADSDNDGFEDGQENGDFNGDGINDALQKDPGLKTGIKGGGGSFGWLALLALLMLTCVRRFSGYARGAAVVLVAIGVSAMHVPTASAQDATATCTSGSGFGEGCWSVSLGAFATKLRPDDSQSVWKVVDDSDVGYKLSLEYRFRGHWFFELGYADMGSASVENRNPAIQGREPIDYSIPSVFAGYSLFDQGSRFNLHAKVGYAMLRTDAASYVIEKQQHSDQVALGAGVSLRLWQRLQLQLEHEYYDKDARQTGLGMRYAF